MLARRLSRRLSWSWCAGRLAPALMPTRAWRAQDRTSRRRSPGTPPGRLRCPPALCCPRSRVSLMPSKATGMRSLSAPSTISRKFRSATPPRIAPLTERSRQAPANHMGDCVCPSRPSAPARATASDRERTPSSSYSGRVRDRIVCEERNMRSPISRLNKLPQPTALRRRRCTAQRSLQTRR